MRRLIHFISILIIASTTQVNAQGPIAWYMFNGNARDTSGNGKHGLEENMSYAADRFGNTNEAAYFSGLAQISANYKGFPTGNSPRTISLWVNKSGNTAKPPMLVGWGYRGSNLMSSLTLQVHTIPYYWGYADDLSSAGVTVVDSQWYHLVFTYEGGVGKFYINGQLNSSGALSPNTPDTLLWIGNFQTQEEFGNFKGKLDDILIYNRALLPNEIDSLYHDGIPTITSFTPTSGPIGTSVTITGTNFNTTAANNVVYFGGVKASVTNATSASLTVTVPTGATYAPITVTDTTTRLSVASKLPFIVTFSGIRGVTSGSFASKVDFVTGTNPNPLSIGDMDGDSKLDIVAINGGENSVSVFRNTSTTGTISTGSLASRVNFNTGNTPFEVAVGDLDGDGLFDMAIVNPNSGTISLLRNTSTTGSITSGSFAAKVDLMAGNFPNGVAIGDIDGDGKADLAVTNQNSNTVSIFRNISVKGSLSTSSFQTKLDFVTGSTPYGIAIYDLDMDGKRDILFANSGDNSISICRNISTIGNITTGSFLSPINFATGANPQQISVSDIDGDEKPEIIVSHFGGSTISLFQNTSSIGSITSESFAPKIEFTTGTAPYEISIADIDGDSKPDIAVTNFNSNTVSILRNTSSVGSITASTLASKIDFSTGNSPNGVILGDIDGDGRVDVAVSNYGASTISLLKNTTNDLVAYYPFTGGSTTDSSGNGNNGTNNSATPTTDRFGNADGAYSFNGTNNYITTNIDVQPSAIPITSWSAWIYPTRLNYASNQAILSSDDGLADRSLTIRQTTDSIAVYVGEGVEWRPFKLNTNQWQHLVVTYKSDNIYVYLNGVKYTYGSAGNILTTVNKLTIGKNPGLTNYFQGSIDDILIFSRQLSDQEVDSLYHVRGWGVPPSAATNLAATAGNQQIALHWNKNTESDFMRYRIYRGTSPNPTTQVDSTSSAIGKNDTTKTFTGLVNGTSYYFRITAIDSMGNVSGYSNEVSAKPSDFIAYYPFTGGSTDDSTGNGNVAQNNGATVTVDRFGSSSRAYSFDGVNNYISTNIDVQPTTLSSTTWIAWIYPTRLGHNQYQAILSSDDDYTDRTINIKSGQDSFNVFVGNTAEWTVPVKAVLNQWQQVAVIYTTTNIYFFHNGKKYTYGSAGNLGATVNKLTIGKNPYTGNFFKGNMDDIRVYGRALAEAEIDSLYRIGNWNYAPTRSAMIPDTALSEDFVKTFRRKLTAHFLDVDNGSLTYTATVLSGSITPTISNDSLYLSSITDYNGSASIKITATDAASASVTDTFVVTISATNDIPTRSAMIPDTALSEDFVKTFRRKLTAHFLDVDNGSLTYTATVLSGSITPTISNDSLYLSSITDYNGSASIKITATDAASASVTDTFVVTISATNDIPTRSAMIPDTALSEDFVKTFRRKLTAHFLDVDNGSLTYTATVLSGSITPTISNDSLYLSSITDYNGSASIKITATDAASASVTDTFTVTISSINDAPTRVSTITDVVDSLEDFSRFNHAVLTSLFDDVDHASLTYTVSVLSGNTIPSLSNDSLYLNSMANDFGISVIEISAMDDSGAVISDTFDVYIEAVNDVPVISDVSQQITLEDTPIMSIPLTVGDVETAVGSLIATGSSSNTALVSEDRIQIEGNGADRILTINPNRNQSGVALITISVNDGSTITKDTFTIVVQPVNDPVQKIYALRDTSFSEDVSRVFAIRLSEHFGDDDDPVLTYQISPLDSGIRTFVHNDSLFVEGVADSNGTKRLVIEAGDGETIANDTVDISLTSQEDAPQLYQTMVDYQMKEDSLTISHRIAIDLKSHFYDPDGDALTFSRNFTDGRGGIQTALSNQTDTLFIWNAVDSNGTFKIAISADDDKGGQKARDTIVLSVFPVNDAPLTSQPVTDIIVNENFSKTAVAYFRSTFRDPDGDVLGYGSFTVGGYTDKVTLLISGDTLYAISKSDSFGVYMGYAKAQDAVTSVADTFRITIKGRPRVTGIQSVSIDTASFVVNASINPNGTTSSLFVRYGRSVTAMNAVSDTSSHSVVGTAVHTLHNLIPDSTYFYRVISFSEAGFDSNSVPLNTRTLQVPSEFDQVTVSDPNPSPGTTITITAKVLGSRADSVILIYGLSKDTIGKRLRMSWNGGLLYSGTIPSASVTINGLWYRVIAYNQRGPKSFPSQGRRQNISIQVSVAAISEIKMVSQFPAGLPENDWSIVSLPVNGSLDLEKYFGKQDMKNGKPTNWSAGTWNTDSNKFISAKILEGGKGYILFHRSKSKNFPFDSIANARTNAPDYFDSIVVHKGWNIIAWPYTYVDTISILAAGFVHNVWTIRDSAGSKVEWTNNSFVMRPYSGFMIKLQNSYPQNTAYLGDLIRRNHKTTVVLSHPNWSIQLAAENDHYRDSKNRIGISESASNGDDGMDGSKPPQFDDRVRLTVRRQEKSGLFENLSSDIRTLTDSGHVWDFEIANAGTGSRFYWISTGIPDNLDAVIVDLTANKAYDIRGNNTVPLIHAEHQFKLIAGNSSFVDQKMKALMETMPTTFSLKQNYPNPFNPTTRIDFDVAHTTHVRIRIYNLLGQEVRTLQNSIMETGRHFVIWDGKDAHDRAVASGVYLYRLEAGAVTKVKKMLLLK